MSFLNIFSQNQIYSQLCWTYFHCFHFIYNTRNSLCLYAFIFKMLRNFETVCSHKHIITIICIYKSKSLLILKLQILTSNKHWIKNKKHLIFPNYWHQLTLKRKQIWGKCWAKRNQKLQPKTRQNIVYLHYYYCSGSSLLLFMPFQINLYLADAKFLTLKQLIT